MIKDIQSFKATFNLLLNDFENLFDPRLTIKLHTLIGEIQTMATMASKSLEESRQHYDQMVIWLQAVNLCHNQNQRDIHNFLQDQVINQHRDDYKLPSPKHRNEHYILAMIHLERMRCPL